jgi:hypothetical protein
MRWWRVLVLLSGVIAFPFSAQAQSAIRLASLKAQLWPEYDQRSMLVIYDFELPRDVKLPVSVSIRFPKDGNLIAVASLGSNGSFVNADYLGPSVNGDWQSITLQIQTATSYHVEYYEPLPISGQLRQFTYLWPGDYAVDDFGVSVRVPADTTNITATPNLQSTQEADGTPALAGDFGALGAGQEFPLQLTYTKTSDTLSVSQPRLQPSQPLGPSTPGRVMLSNYLPYILGVLGFLMIAAGAVYIWQSRRSARLTGSRHRHPSATAEDDAPGAVYCHQCGTRAEHGDRFCRVCGARLRLSE